MPRSLHEMKIREALRLKSLGLNNSQIARSPTINCARSTLVDLIKRCQVAGVDYELAKDMTDEELRNKVYPKSQNIGRPEKDFDEAKWYAYVQEHGCDKMTAWEEAYLKENPGGLGYAQFSHRLKVYKEKNFPDLDYPQKHQPGKEMQTDWCGDTLDVIYSPERQGYITAHFFVATLGFSGKLFARAYPDEKQENWLDAHTRALEFFGAVPLQVVPDNTKTAIKKSHRYDPERNPAFQMWAEHYNVAITPTRAGKPKDKALVERGVGSFQRKILPRLKEQLFFSFEDLNQEILLALDAFNRKPYQSRPGSREKIFREVDLPAMRPLPANRFSSPKVQWVSVSKNGYHVTFDKHQYSAPYQLAGQKVLLVATNMTVELVYDNKRIALHQRSYSPSEIYVTDPLHMPQNHLAQAEIDAMTVEKYLNWGAKIGPRTKQLVDNILSGVAIPEQEFANCMGILRLADKYSPFLLEKAAEKAVALGVTRYKQIRKLLDEISQKIWDTQTVNDHENIRGAKYYGGQS